mmetsp:Transcript_14660/g.27835  ORF Transcript_14660/g.27835 Transcript_14660/m.27835 type:complete len:290 (-) Transcript_14660:753-1622(-)
MTSGGSWSFHRFAVVVVFFRTYAMVFFRGSMIIVVNISVVFLGFGCSVKNRRERRNNLIHIGIVHRLRQFRRARNGGKMVFGDVRVFIVVMMILVFGVCIVEELFSLGLMIFVGMMVRVMVLYSFVFIVVVYLRCNLGRRDINFGHVRRRFDVRWIVGFVQITWIRQPIQGSCHIQKSIHIGSLSVPSRGILTIRPRRINVNVRYASRRNFPISICRSRAWVFGGESNRIRTGLTSYIVQDGRIRRRHGRWSQKPEKRIFQRRTRKCPIGSKPSLVPHHKIRQRRCHRR